ncbi:triacylglycerol lipase [Massilia sp. W12]|uniref:esterase/lipase family protein n=1 Tax=Massilia sp. W12 TaxID=3126507 RepID=UPI0030CB7F46
MRKLAGLALLATLPLSGQAAGYTQTQYPIVLVHGLFGFDRIGPVEYFYGIPAALRSGGATVYTPQVSAANATEVRGEQLLSEVKRIVAVTGKAKVNLMGHSHGGPTIRYVASVRPDLVASATSIAGVNKGSKVADIILGVAPDGSLSNSVLRTIADGLGKLLSALSGSPNLPQNAMAAARSLSTEGAARFNAAHPGGLPASACGEGAYFANGVAYFSWSGGKTFTNIFDPLDGPMALTGLAFGGAKNDGLVASCSSHLGRVIRDDYAMNHADEINQSVGIVHLFETNPVTVFRQHANRLQQMGL